MPGLMELRTLERNTGHEENEDGDGGLLVGLRALRSAQPSGANAGNVKEKAKALKKKLEGQQSGDPKRAVTNAPNPKAKANPT
jgi:hypothetical protein